MNEVIFDIEADDLDATKIHCLSYREFPNGDTKTITDYQDMRDFFRSPAIRIGHNIRRYDIPTLSRILGIRLDGDYIDTLAVSWYLEPSRKKNSLESYGEEFGIPKIPIDNWESLPLETYIKRCERDVLINSRLWKSQRDHLLEIYQNPDDLWSFLKYLDFKMYSAELAERSRWKLDIEWCENAIKKLEPLQDEKRSALEAAMPRVPVVKTFEPPKRRYRADGQPSVLELRWQERLESQGLSSEHEGPIQVITGYNEPNSGSHEQIKSWLYSLGWKPQTFKHQRSKTTGDTKEIPQVYKEHGNGAVCDSVRDLFDEEPALEHLDSLGVISHRLGLLRGFLRDVSPDGYLKASIAGLTNTLRFKHAEIVNLPKPEVPYGSDIRGCLTSILDHELCGADMSGLEDRLKQHFIFPHDPDYVRDLQSDDYDPHLDIAVLAGGLTEEESNYYKSFDDSGDKSRYKKIKSARSIFKNGNYACQYGAGVPRLMVTCGIERSEAANLHKTYWERNWAIKAVADEQEIREVRGQMYLKNPINGFYYSLRFEKDIFSTLVQGSAAYCFDIWLSYILDEREQLTGQFHDEVILEVSKGYREEVKEFLDETIRKTNDLLGLNVPLGIGVQFGERYSEIH